MLHVYGFILEYCFNFSDSRIASKLLVYCTGAVQYVLTLITHTSLISSDMQYLGFTSWSPRKAERRRVCPLSVQNGRGFLTH